VFRLKVELILVDKCVFQLGADTSYTWARYGLYAVETQSKGQFRWIAELGAYQQTSLNSGIATSGNGHFALAAADNSVSYIGCCTDAPIPDTPVCSLYIHRLLFISLLIVLLRPEPSSDDPFNSAIRLYHYRAH